MGFGAQRAITDLMRHIEGEVPRCRIGGDDPWNPLLVIPAPRGFAAWIGYKGGSYIAFVSRRVEPVTMWHKLVGHRKDPLSNVWTLASHFFHDHFPPDQPAPSHAPTTAPGAASTSSPPVASEATERAVGGIPGGAHFVMDRQRYPRIPSVELLQEIATGLEAIFAEGSCPTVVDGQPTPTIMLTTHGAEQFVIGGAYNSLAAVVFVAGEDEEAVTRRGPYLLDCEFVHEPISATLMIAAEFIALLEEARDDESLPLRLRADLEDEATAARLLAGAMFMSFVKHGDQQAPGSLTRRARWAIEPLRQAFLLTD